MTNELEKKLKIAASGAATGGKKMIKRTDADSRRVSAVQSTRKRTDNSSSPISKNTSIGIKSSGIGASAAQTAARKTIQKSNTKKAVANVAKKVGKAALGAVIEPRAGAVGKQMKKGIEKAVKGAASKTNTSYAKNNPQRKADHMKNMAEQAKNMAASADHMKNMAASRANSGGGMSKIKKPIGSNTGATSRTKTLTPSTAKIQKGPYTGGTAKAQKVGTYTGGSRVQKLNKRKKEY